MLHGKPDLSALIAWLETKDPETAYFFESLDDCLLARFIKETRNEAHLWVAHSVICGGLRQYRHIAYYEPPTPMSEKERKKLKLHTYGKALGRAREVAEGKIV